jgi:Transcription factor WhiB/MarR family
VTVASLGPRQAAVLAHLGEHAGLTAGELARVFGVADSLHQLLRRLEQKALVVSVTAQEPGQGRQATRWYVAPPGTVSPPRAPADPVAVRHRRERDRLNQRARRARARGLVVVSGMEPPSLRDLQGSVPALAAAACKGADPDLFFPAAGQDAIDPRRSAQAKAICAGCPVRVQCYEAAVRRGERHGIWGGADFGEPRKAARAS